jgi:predicted permease
MTTRLASSSTTSPTWQTSTFDSLLPSNLRPEAGSFPLSNLILLVLCFALGALARRWGGLPPESHRVVNAWVVNVSLPALVLRSIRDAPLEAASLLGVGGLWVVFLAAAGVSLLARRGGLLDARQAGGMALAVGLGNTAFVGLPLIEALGGGEALALAVVVDQLGSFGALTFLAMPFAAGLAGRSFSPGAHLSRMLRFPPMVALLLALLLRGVAFPPVVEGVLERLASMLSPLALASVGWLFQPSALRGRWGRVLVGLLGRLAVAPALVLALLWLARGTIGLPERVAVAQAAMGPMVTAVVLASEHDLEADLGVALLALGVPLSGLTVPIWWRLLGG